MAEWYTIIMDGKVCTTNRKWYSLEGKGEAQEFGE